MKTVAVLRRFLQQCPDKNPGYGEASAELKKEGLLPKETQYREGGFCNSDQQEREYRFDLEAGMWDMAAYKHLRRGAP